MYLKQATIAILMVMVIANLKAIEIKPILNTNNPDLQLKENLIVDNEYGEILTTPSGAFIQFNDEKELKIRLNGGRKFTNKKEIEVEIRPIKLSATLVAKMKVGLSPDLSDTEWEPFQFNKSLNIPIGEGPVVVYAKLQDKAGNDSPIENAQIIVDTTPPTQGSVVINKGAEFTSDPEMRVRLSIQANEAYKMQISNTPGFANATWEDFVPEKNWSIGPRSEGNKTVYVRFVDLATNISEPVHASIMVDLTPPVGKVEINDGATYTNNRNIKLKIKADDATVVRIIGPGIQNVPYENSLATGGFIKEWELDSIDGKKYVKVYFRDNAGNITEDPVIDDIILDTTPPEVGLFRINQGDKYCTQPEGLVTLQIASREDPSTFQMLVSNSKEFKDAKPMAYTPMINNWPLENQEDGLKTVYLKFFDQAGNESQAISSKILLDRSVPIAKSITIDDNREWVNSNYSSLKLEAHGADFMELSNSIKFSNVSAWEKFNPNRMNWVLPVKDGKIEVFVRFKDQAGNVSEIISDYILKDTKAPDGKLYINENERFTNDPSKSVKLKLVHDDDAFEMQLSNTPAFNGVDWQPIQGTINNWPLEGEDGEKRVFARYKDKAGNVSEIIAAGIILDTQPPMYPSISVNGDSTHATRMDKMVTVEFSAEDATQMMASFSPDFANERWEDFATTKMLMLPGTDGEKELFVKYRDLAGNISQVVSDKIMLDRYPPKPISFKINNGEEWTNNNEKIVTLHINAEGASEMIIGDNPSFSGSNWQAYQSVITKYMLSGEDGEKTLFISFKDEAGHQSKNLTTSIRLKREF